MQQSRKYQFAGPQSQTRDEDDSRQQQQQQQEAFVLPQQVNPRGLFDPSNFFADFDTGNENVQAFWKVPCAIGSSRRPCHWIPITCMQWNQGTYNSWWDSFWDGFSNTSLKRTVVIKKNLDRSTPLLQRFIKGAVGLQKTTIVFIRKIQPIRTQDSSEHGGGGGGGGGCGDKECYGRCDRCRRARSGSGASVSDWESRFPYRQAAIVINLYCARISASTMFAGQQCRSKPTGCNVGCQSFPSPWEASTWTGGPGLAGAGHDWEVVGQGPNFPNNRNWHGLGPLAQEQYQVMWSSAEIEVELRNPINGCRYWKERQTIPV